MGNPNTSTLGCGWDANSAGTGADPFFWVLDVSDFAALFLGRFEQPFGVCNVFFLLSFSAQRQDLDKFRECQSGGKHWESTSLW